MAIPLARRPRFLSEIPDVPAPEPVRFAPAGPRGATPPPRPPARAHAHAAAQGPDLAAAHREALEKVASAVALLRTQADHLAEQARADAIEIAFLVARRILEAELRQGPDALFALVRTAVAKAGASRRVVVRLHPADAAVVQQELGRGEAGALSAARVEVEADGSLQPGDCMVDTDYGQVDGRLATRLAELRRAVDAAGDGA